MKPRILTTTIAILLSARAFAVTDTWDGGDAVSNNINVGANWLDNTAPLSDLVNTDLIFAGVVRLTPNVSAVFSTNSVTFNNTAGAFIFAGTTLNIGAGGIVNNDTQTQTFDNAITLGAASASFNAASGGLTFNNNVNINANTLALDGAGAFSLGLIFGGGTVNKNGAGTMTWAPNTTQTLDLAINAGTVNTVADATADVFSAAASLAVNGTSILNLNENTVLDGAQLTRTSAAGLTLAAGKTLTVQNGGDAILTGGFTNTTASTITVIGAGSTFTTMSTLTLGSGSTTNVFAGGSVSAGAGAVAIASSGNGTVTVDGNASSIAGGTLSIGSSGNTGSLTFTNGSSGAFGAINTGNSGTATSNGTLSIQGGATVTGTSLASATASVAATGTVTITGVASQLTLTGAGVMNLGSTTTSTANFNVQSGGTFNSGTGTTTVNATAHVNITGGTFNANGNMTLNGTGAQLNGDATGAFNLAAGKLLTIQGGADASFASFSSFAGANVTVTGAGSTLQTTSGGLLNIRGGSVLTIQSGGSVSAPTFLDVGIGSSGTLTVDGAGSSVSAGNSFWGDGATANVTFSNAATGNFAGLTIAISSSSTAQVQVLTGANVSHSGVLQLAHNTTASNGTLTVDGTGSTWTQTGSSTVILGDVSGSTATLNVQNGGTFTTGTGTTTVNATAHVNITGGTFTANGSVTLNGTGAQLNVDATGDLTVAAGNTFLILNGADAVFTNLYATEGSNLTLSGTGSTLQTGFNFYDMGGSTVLVQAGASLTSAGGLHVGTNGSGILTVNGSTVSAASLSSWANSSGTANVSFASSATGTFAGVDIANNPAAGSTGTAQVLTGADVTSGSLNIGSNGTAVNSGSLSVDGAGSSWTQTGTSAFTLGGAANSTGALTVSNGGAFTSGTGAFTVRALGTLNINGGTLTVNGAFSNSGTLTFTAGTLALLGTNNLAIGTGGLLGTSLTLLSDRTLAIGGTTTIDATRTLTINGGTFRTGVMLNNGTLDFQKGTLGITGAGGFNIGTGVLGANVVLSLGANLEVTNTTTIAAGALLRVDGGSFTGGSVVNSGTIDHRDGTLNFTGALTNNAGARFFLSGLGSPAGAITNAGTITLQNGLGYLGGAGAITNTGLITGDGTIAKPVTNSATGQLRAELGKTLTFTGAVVANAGTMSLQGGTLEFTTAITNSATGFISGRGALRTNGLTNNGVLAFSGGTADIFGDVTNASGARIVTSGAGATTTFYDDVVHNGLEIFTGANASTVFFGGQSGAGSFTGTGTVYFNGDLRPGNSPASVLYEGDLVFASASTLTLELGGLLAGTQYDHLNIGGTLHADGALDVVLYGGFAPHFGDTFDLFDAGALTGSFDDINLPALSGDLTWDDSQLSTNGTLRVVPEPGVGVLLASALALLGLRRRRSKNNAIILSAVPCGRRREGTESKNLSHPAGGGGTEMRAGSCSAPPSPEEKSEILRLRSAPLSASASLRMTGFFGALRALAHRLRPAHCGEDAAATPTSLRA